MSIHRGIWSAALFVCGMVSVPATPASALTETTLYTFCTTSGCADGEHPGAPLLKSGNKLYGTAGGGANGKGVVFQYNTNNGNYKVLYSFCATTFMGVCSDGEGPSGPLIADTSGNLYGTTSLGGNVHNAGTVYELIKPMSGGVWTYHQIYAFCPTRIGSGFCPDGNDPLSGVTYAGAAGGTPYDGTSLLFGITFAGGSSAANSLQGTGTVFALQLSGGTWSEKVLHAFCATCTSGCTSCSDGEYAEGQIVLDASDDIWGTTTFGGSNSSGAAWELVPGANLWTDPWTETVEYNFCWNGASKCGDGRNPTGVLLDAAGDIFGTTQLGGNGMATLGNGILFELTAGSSCTEGGTATFLCETVKHNFCHTTCADGDSPGGYIVMDGSGNIFGAAGGGSTASDPNGAGVIYEQSGGTNTTVFTFCTATGTTCPAGDGPGPVILDAAGDLFGPTGSGGDATNQAGVLFELN